LFYLFVWTQKVVKWFRWNHSYPNEICNTWF
jgi:hypothetical protein